MMLPSMKTVPLIVRSFVPLSQESSPRIVEPAIDLHVYEVARREVDRGPALQLIELSATAWCRRPAAKPVDVVQGESGPRSAFWYQ